MARKVCNVCNTRTVGTGGSEPLSAKHSELCGLCYDESGWENTHSDGGHNAIQAVIENKGADGLDEQDTAELEWMKDCWICHPELNLAQKPAKAKKTTGAKKTQGFRRTQLNHKDMCTHAQEPKARRTCKEAFWAGVSAMVAEGNLTEDQAWEHCIAQLVAPKANPTKMTVTPRGPKGGVINKLKEGKPSKA